MSMSPADSALLDCLEQEEKRHQRLRQAVIRGCERARAVCQAAEAAAVVPSPSRAIPSPSRCFSPPPVRASVPPPSETQPSVSPTVGKSKQEHWARTRDSELRRRATRRFVSESPTATREGSRERPLPERGGSPQGEKEWVRRRDDELKRRARGRRTLSPSPPREPDAGDSGTQRLLRQQRQVLADIEELLAHAKSSRRRVDEIRASRPPSRPPPSRRDA
eukprot:Hpha_TRINITY_DN5783_c0_g1::TRINITY_DN5783_c0_g1_i1::g.147486::m.147486